MRPFSLHRQPALPTNPPAVPSWCPCRFPGTISMAHAWQRRHDQSALFWSDRANMLRETLGSRFQTTRYLMKSSSRCCHSG